jgi:hypothetical protein
MTASTIMPDWMRQRPAALEIAPDEVDAVSLFFALATQWLRHATTGIRLGLNYAVIAPTAQMLGVAMTPALFGDLQAMEAEVLKVDGERSR